MSHHIPTRKETEKSLLENKRLKPDPVHHEIYPRIGTSDRQRKYLVAHGIKHVRADGEYR